jgi:hypothetical protein
LHELPDFHTALCIGAAAVAMANCRDEVARLRARLQQIDPTLRVSCLRDRFRPYRDREHPARCIESLRRAGLLK